jgi:uncharacterized RDD family membrane protein YckC
MPRESGSADRSVFSRGKPVAVVHHILHRIESTRLAGTGVAGAASMRRAHPHRNPTDVDGSGTAVFVTRMFTIIGGDGREYGPVSADQVRAWMSSGRANLDTKARTPDSDEWRRLGDYPEFSETDDDPPVIPAPPEGFDTPQSFVVSEPGIELASLGQRFGAALIDGTLKALCWLPTASAIWAVVGEEIRAGRQPSPAELMAAMDGVLIKSLPFLITLAVAQGVLIARRSQSIGKLIIGIRILRVRSNRPAGFVHGFLLRGTIPWVLEQIPFLGAMFWCLDVSFIFGRERRCGHDFIAGTKVVKV